MAIRVFRCDECGHRLRWGATKCGACFASTPPANRIGFSAMALSAALGLGIVWLIL